LAAAYHYVLRVPENTMIYDRMGRFLAMKERIQFRFSAEKHL
jgi:hypothetical protein